VHVVPVAVSFDLVPRSRNYLFCGRRRKRVESELLPWGLRHGHDSRARVVGGTGMAVLGGYVVVAVSHEPLKLLSTNRKRVFGARLWRQWWLSAGGGVLHPRHCRWHLLLVVRAPYITFFWYCCIRLRTYPGTGTTPPCSLVLYTSEAEPKPKSDWRASTNTTRISGSNRTVFACVRFAVVIRCLCPQHGVFFSTVDNSFCEIKYNLININELLSA